MNKLKEILKTRNAKVGLVIGVFLAAMLVVAVVNIGNESCPNVANSPVDSSVTGKMLTENPEAYKCKVVELRGQVFDTEKSNDTNAWQVWTDPENSEGNVAVYYGGKSDIGNDDYIKLTGVVGDVLSGKNAFGGDVSAPTINASSVQKIDRDQAVAPAIKTIKPNKTQTKAGVSVTVKKIEFAANETRVYLEIKNNSSSSASLYSFNTKVTQSGSQVKDKTPYSSDNKAALPDEILAHTTENGKMYFEKSDPTKPLTITLGGYSESDYQDLNYKFAI